MEPVIVEDDEPETPEPEAAAISAPATVGVDLPPLRTQHQGEEAQSQQQEEVVAEDGRGSSGEPEPEEWEEERSQLDMNKQISSDLQASEDSDPNRDTKDEVGEDDDPRPAKRRKVRLGAPPSNLDLEATSSQPRRVTLPSAPQLGLCSTGSKADRRSPPALVNDT